MISEKVKTILLSNNIVIFLIVLIINLVINQSVIADEGESITTPFKINNSTLAGVGLGEFAAWPDTMILEGTSKHTLSEVFSGEIVIGVYQSETIKLAITEPWPFDEMILILNGELYLHHSEEKIAKKFIAGDIVIVPKGYTGTWKMLGQYRELFVVEKQAFLKSQEPGGLISDSFKH